MYMWEGANWQYRIIPPYKKKVATQSHWSIIQVKISTKITSITRRYFIFAGRIFTVVTVHQNFSNVHPRGVDSKIKADINEAQIRQLSICAQMHRVTRSGSREYFYYNKDSNALNRYSPVENYHLHSSNFGSNVQFSVAKYR